MKKFILIPIFLFLAATSCFGQSLIPQVMAFQGYVTTDTGAFTGQTAVTLTLYDAFSGGNQVWSQTWPDTVHVQQGYYSVVMDFSYPGHWQGGAAGFTKQYWLDANVLGQDLNPRIQITASAYSFVADTALHVHSSVPIGTIIAYGLSFTPQVDSDWLPCDGRLISNVKYPGYAIQAASVYGQNSTLDSTYLPDLRGLFLRGVNAGRSDSLADQDFSQRIPWHGASGTDLVGTIQKDTLGSHIHGLSQAVPDIKTETANTPGESSFGWNGTVSSIIVPSGGRETRPKNAYVYWIIKVK